jgi:hypothetical protein
MKKSLLSILIFIIAFVATYIIVCYFPGMMIKLQAPPKEYFIENLKHMAPFKSVIAFLVGVIAAIIPLIAKKKYN